MIYVVLAIIAFVVVLDCILGHFYHKIKWSFDNAKLQEEARSNNQLFYHCSECANKMKNGEPRDPKCATMVTKLRDPSKGWNSSVYTTCCSCAEKCACPEGQLHVMNYSKGVPVIKTPTSKHIMTCPPLSLKLKTT